MPTTQVRDVPQDAYQALRRRAEAAGQSLQSYMRAQLIELASRRAKTEVLAGVEQRLTAAEIAIDVADIVAARDAERR